jgi:hypothetical protein
MSEAENEMLRLLAELVQATKQMATLVSEMSARLERNARINVHVNGEVPTPPFTWPYPATQSIPNACAKCGLKMEGVMGYVCPNGGNCPTGLGGFASMAA